MVRFLLTAALMVVGVTSAAGADPASVRLAGEALQILEKNCFECHGPDARGAGTFSFLDRAAVARLVIPGKPESSELFDLAAGGIMPPGKKARLSRDDVTTLNKWIKAGAPALLGDEYVWNAIAADLATRADDVANLRYFTLHHRLAAGDTPSDLLQLRNQLNALIQHLTGNKSDLPKAIDPAQVVLRIDLSKLGWDKKPMLYWKWLTEPGADKMMHEVYKNPDFNHFDMLLLEYPYGFVPSANPAFTALVKPFLLKSRAIRPIPAIHVDWFLARAAAGKLYDMLVMPVAERTPLPQGLSTVYGAAVTPAVASAELGVVLPDQKAVARADWEKTFVATVQRLKLGTPITLDDSLLEEGRTRNPQPGLTLAWHEATSKQPQMAFKDGDKAYLFVKNESTADLYLDMILTNAKGERLQMTRFQLKLTPGMTWTFPSPDNPLPFDKDDVGEMLTVAFSSTVPFPQGTFFRIPKENMTFAIPSRVVHAFYQLTDEGQIKAESNATTISRLAHKVTINGK